MTKRLASAVLLTCGACSGGGPAEPSPPLSPSAGFSFSSFVERPLLVTVTRDGAPAPGAEVGLASVRTPGTESAATPSETFANGLTGADGRCALIVRLPRAVDAVDVVVHVPGAVGSYTHEQLRATDGPCAVSSRVTHGVGGLASVDVALTEDAR